jgi:Fur family peroxide stress response transcriptional regulator
MDGNPKQFRKRSAILDCLRGTDSHPSAEDLHAMLGIAHPDISLATVYRNLAMFKKQGIIQSLGTVNGIERFDANTAPHVHFICSECSAVLDLPELRAPEELRTAAAKGVGGSVSACQLTFTGLCGRCCHNPLG